MITVEVSFFGGQHLFTRRLDPQVARTLPKVELEDGATVNDLLRLLNVPSREGRPLVSINRYFARDNVLLSDGDRVQLLRTVVGG